MQKVMDVLTLREHHARTLLIHHRWNVERLLSVLVEKGRDQLFAEAGVSIVEPMSYSSFQSSPLVTCDVCMEDFSSQEVTTMECGHFFCNYC